jgi:glycosyltransferase involved in cell wall biosynthesis
LDLTTIVTIAKNHEKGLQATLESIQILENVNIEVILVVGLSTDRTIEIAEKFAETTTLKVKLIIQTSSGIYEAMNEGVLASSGSSIIFMNAGDCFENPYGLKALLTELTLFEVGVVIGGYSIDSFGKEAHVKRRGELSPIEFAFNRTGGCHQAMLYDTNCIKSLNLYPLEYRLAADFDLTLRIISSFGGRRIAELIALVEPGGVADKGIIQVHKEKHHSRSTLFGRKSVTAYSFFWCYAAIAKISIRNQSKKLLR